MAANQFNIGKDVTLSFIGPTGPFASFGLQTEFEMRQAHRTLTSIPINNNGIPVRRNTYQGWEGHLMVDRQNGTGDALANLLEANFYAGNPDIKIAIAETIRNSDGTTDRFNYVDCTIAQETGGRFAGDEKVSQRFIVTAAQRIAG